MSEQTYLVLAALLAGPLHGYGVIQRVRELSEGRVILAVGTLYGALDRLADQGLVVVAREEVVSGRPRRYFELTDDGLAAVTAEAQRMERAARIVTDRLGRRQRPTPSTDPATGVGLA